MWTCVCGGRPLCSTFVEHVFAHLVKKDFRLNEWTCISRYYLNILFFYFLLQCLWTFCDSICEKAYVHVFINSVPCVLCSLHARSRNFHCMPVFVQVCVQMCANGIGRHGQLSGEADNSPKCCPWFHGLMNSTAENLLTGNPARSMTNYWCSQLLALLHWGERKRQFVYVFVWAWFIT